MESTAPPALAARRLSPTPPPGANLVSEIDVGMGESWFDDRRGGFSLKQTRAAPLIAVRIGRGADYLCFCEPRVHHPREPTFELALIRVCFRSAEGGTEP